MIRVKKYGRKWFVYGDETLLVPWAKDIEQIPGILIKRNGSCNTWRVTADDQNEYFVKRERCFHFPFTKSRAEKEYQAFVLLEEKGIPCVECSAWSATFDDSIIITRVLPSKFCTLLKYWCSKPESDIVFLEKLCSFLTDTAQAGISIPDLRAENLMTDGESIVIINPAGAAESKATDSPAPETLQALEIAFGELPVEQIAEILHSSGMYASGDAAVKVLEEMKKKWEEQNEKEWNRIRPTLLSKTSKFVTKQGAGAFFRNSAWFTPIMQYPEGILEEKEMSEDEAKKLWLDSFHCQIRKKACAEIPVIYEKTGDKVKLSILKDKKYSFFYGFR